MKYVRTYAVAEEVVQVTYLAVFEGIDRYERRSSFKTWVCKILVNRAMTRGVRESRYVSFSRDKYEGDPEENTILQDRLVGFNYLDPERLFLAKEYYEVVQSFICTLPRKQQVVMVLRGFDGLDSQEVCHRLHISPTNQRVLLHRARSKVRQQCRRYLFGDS